MTDSTGAPDWGKWFKAHRQELADNGFTEELMRRLPPKPSLLPQAIIALAVVGSLVAGLFVSLAVLDFSMIIGRAQSLAAAVDASTITSLSSWLSVLSSAIHTTTAAIATAATLATANSAATVATFISPLSVGVAAVSIVCIMVFVLTTLWENREAAW
ncbi:MAG: DUF5056 domain-containing protein [Prevotellaceae bacterium]|jgi:hypothetical protein|nr:DUF5056 domain-containing protein [Prevotellaceae bacterium]